ncbi:MAG: hypothetical protein U1E27_01665 [Kiritimatiellia bacterium]|nr:hypothetical protein [Kiritimatiellia bacterium]
MKMTPEVMTEELAQTAGLPLCMVLLYGSAASGEQTGTRPGANLLIVLERLGRTELDALAGPVRRWIRAGHPSPQLFTKDRLTRSADVFPIEIQDLKETGRVLFGEDLLARVRIQPEHLRIEVEHELKGKLAYLQSEYLRVGESDRALRGLLAGSLSTFLILARALLRFFDPVVPPRKSDALRALCGHIALDAEALETVQAIKDGLIQPRGPELRDLWDRYLTTVEQLVITADTRLDPGGGVLWPDDKTTQERTSP